MKRITPALAILALLQLSALPAFSQGAGAEWETLNQEAQTLYQEGKYDRVLEQSRRCLRRGGQLIAMVPNATSPFGTMTRYWDFTHLAAFTPSSVRQLQRLCGFRSIEYREWGPRPHGLTSTIRYMLWQVIRGMIWFRLMVETASGKGGIYTADMLFRLTK